MLVVKSLLAVLLVLASEPLTAVQDAVYSSKALLSSAHEVSLFLLSLVILLPHDDFFMYLVDFNALLRVLVVESFLLTLLCVARTAVLVNLQVFAVESVHLAVRKCVLAHHV